VNESSRSMLCAPVREVVWVFVYLLFHSSAGSQAHRIGSGRLTERHIEHGFLHKCPRSRFAKRRSNTSRLIGKTAIWIPPCSAAPVSCSSAKYPVPSGIATNWRIIPFSTQ